MTEKQYPDIPQIIRDVGGIVHSDGNIFFKDADVFMVAADHAMRAAQPENAAVAGPSAPVSPMAKMALALREKSAAERNDFDRRVQSGEWGAMPEPSTEADALPNHVAEVKGDDAIRILRWSNRVGAFDYPVGTKLYATPTQPAAPPAVSQGTMNGVKTVHELHSEIKAQAECAFAQGHGFGVDYASPSDRAWIEGYAHALATQPQEAAPSQELTLFNPRRALEIFKTAQAGSSLDVGTLRGIMAILSDWESRPDPHGWLVPSQDAEDSARLDWLDLQVKKHAVYNGYKWQEAWHESDRGLVCAIQTGKGKTSARKAIDAARAQQGKM